MQALLPDCHHERAEHQSARQSARFWEAQADLPLQSLDLDNGQPNMDSLSTP